jgi:hypothetical protein
MLVRVRGYNDGFANYLRTGQKNGNHLHRDDLDKRLILSGDLDITDSIVNSMPDNGDDRYLHIALPFKEDYISEDMLKTVLDEFKCHLMNAYSEQEYAFYAEAHIPKIKHVLNEKTGEMEDRKPHIHIIIPKVNLVDGSYLNPLGYYPHNEKYVEAIQESLNYQYGFESPRDNRRFDITDVSDYISKYKGDFFKSDVRSFKENLLATILSDKDINYEKFISYLEKQGQIKVRNPGEKQYLNIKPERSSKGVNLKDYVFTKAFIDMSYSEKLNFITSSSFKRDDAKKEDDYGRDMACLSEWINRRSHEIKHFHPNSKEYKRYKGLTDDEKQLHLQALIASRQTSRNQSTLSGNDTGITIQNLLIQTMKEKYNVRRKNISEKPSVYGNEREGLLRQHVEGGQKLSQYRVRKLQLGELDSSLFEQTRVLLQTDAQVVMGVRKPGVSNLVRYPIDRTDARRGGWGVITGHWHVAKEAEIEYTVNAIKRSSDNYLESVRSNTADRLLADTEADRADWQLIRSQLNGYELLRSLQHTHGLDIEKYSVTKSKKGEDRIRSGSRSYSVNDFLTKELNLNWQEAGDYLKREHHRQRSGDLLNTLSAPPKNYWSQFKEWDRAKNTWAAGWKELREDQARQRTLLNKTFRQRTSEVWRDETSTFTEKKSDVAALRLEKLKSRQLLQQQHQEERARLKVALSTHNRFIEYLRLCAEQGDREALKELRNSAKRKERQPSSDYFEAPTNATTILLDKVTYTVKNNGSVSYLINNKEAVIDTREWVSVVQNDNDEAIELAIRLALEKNGYRPLTLNGDEHFIDNVVRVARQNNINVSFVSYEVNEKFKQDESRRRTQAKVNKSRACQ